MAGSGRDAGLVCRLCKRTYGIDERRFECDCKGLLDITGLSDEFSESLIDRDVRGIFRYRRMMPSIVDGFWESATMGEGETALIGIGDGSGVLLKMDFAMPTLSFKDRGAAVLMAAAKAIGAGEVVQDSSGNAGNSVAAYSTRLGISCEVMVPESTSPNKVAQIKAYGAKVSAIAGTREDTAAAALKAARSGRFYASHVYNPLFYQGTKTYIYEVWEQMDGRLPDALAVPVGNGTLLLGIYLGLKSLMAGGCISAFPMILAVQAERCAPVYRAFVSGSDEVGQAVNEGTSAEGIAIAAPARGSQVLSAVREMGGNVIAAEEADILPAARALASLGVFVEPTSAATLAGSLAWTKKNGFGGSVLVPMCGAGLKSLH